MRYVGLVLVAAVLCACRTSTEVGVDPNPEAIARYEQDVAECQELALKARIPEGKKHDRFIMNCLQARGYEAPPSTAEQWERGREAVTVTTAVIGSIAFAILVFSLIL